MLSIFLYYLAKLCPDLFSSNGKVFCEEYFHSGLISSCEFHHFLIYYIFNFTGTMLQGISRAEQAGSLLQPHHHHHHHHQPLSHHSISSGHQWPTSSDDVSHKGKVKSIFTSPRTSISVYGLVYRQNTYFLRLLVFTRIIGVTF